MKKWENWYLINDEFSKFSNVKTILHKGKKINDVRFSIVIPMYTRYEHLKEALNSAVSQDIDENYEITYEIGEYLKYSNKKIKKKFVLKMLHPVHLILYWIKKKNYIRNSFLNMRFLINTVTRII